MKALLSRLSGMQVFKIVLFGQVVSLLGSSLSRFALGIWVYQLTGSVTQFSLATFFAVAPSLILSPFAGSLVDRWDRRWAMILSDAAAGLGTLLMAFLVWTGRAELWHLYLIIASNAAFGTLQFPAYSATMTLLIPRDQLSRANGMALLFGPSLTTLLAPLLAGFLIGTIELKGILLLDGITCVFALLILLAVRIPQPPEEPQDARKAKTTVLADSVYGWQFVRKRPGLLLLLLLFAVINFAMGMVETLITPLVLSFAPSSVLGAVVTGAGLGMLAGSILMSVWKGPERRVRAILCVLALQGIMLLMGGMRASAVLIGVAAFVYLACLPLINTCSQTIWQSKIPPAVQGRVFAIRQMVTSSSIPLATLVAGPLADRLFEPLLTPGGPLADSVGRLLGVGPGRGIGLLFIVLGLLVVVAAAFGYRQASLRNVETDLPDVPDAADAEDAADALPQAT